MNKLDKDKLLSYLQEERDDAEKGFKSHELKYQFKKEMYDAIIDTMDFVINKIQSGKFDIKGDE